ncbi:prolyl oligopeptidase [Hyphomonas neptunium ATCC 15444]|uniref:Prolyl oligopeptidase n=2 Tax=Hyphomonas TaxID=85 RepID=Q0C675_HYPNA|nr:MULTISPECIES: prolyl oligopeptidase family serine peptidase [Hyphomonas]ABI78274.1 prolyl oligopeptidase [Hyphomonas neptunium ATCC 15444]KCZ94848.1 prolyl oligopeptidase [Hyphomonas hirschiana VP5]
MRTLIVSLSALLLAACASDPQPETNLTADNPTSAETASVPFDAASHLWLEEVEGEAALAWVTAQNERTLAELEADPRYAPFEAAALEVLNASERIPYGTVRDGYVYNFWQDETNVRGLWRRTPLGSYGSDTPAWETIVDFDKLAAEEGANWVYKGADCLRPAPGGEWRCLVSLSDGGKDAVVTREFNLSTKTFVEDGFITPEAKQGLAWAGPDTLLIATDWGAGSLTESGYPFIVKRWQRGTPLESAQELIRGKETDVGVWPMTMKLEDGRILQGAVQAETFFTSKYFWFPEGENAAVQWPLPPKASPNGIYKGQFLFSIEQDWAPEGQGPFQAGDLLAFDLETFLETRALPPVTLAFRPSETQAVNGVAVAKGAALLSINDNVVGKLLRIEPSASGWTTTPIELPGTGQVGITFADENETTVFLNYEDFLTPSSLLNYEVATGAVTPLKSLPAKFDTAGLTVEQFFATSKDGTRVPYFIVHREDIPLDGTTPALLYGYGGFQVSMNPGYSPVSGRLWLEQGGAYILANIRGGGEFGPNWHQAGLKLNRQRIYDDFIAVGEDVIARNITSPEHLGIMGGSNGGLLMGVMLNQRPDLWNAVVVQVPLLDMLRYHLLLAGASWVDEYGSPDVPEERAFLETISPYQNFDASKDYPVPFFVTSTKDDRVHPGHARKMAKRFEEAGLPFYYFENMDGGHAAAADQTARAKRSALEFTYLARQLFPAPPEE